MVSLFAYVALCGIICHPHQKTASQEHGIPLFITYDGKHQQLFPCGEETCLKFPVNLRLDATFPTAQSGTAAACYSSPGFTNWLRGS